MGEGGAENTLTKREELSFLMVLAFPKASRMGLACSSCFSSSPCSPEQAQTHRNECGREKRQLEAEAGLT